MTQDYSKILTPREDSLLDSVKARERCKYDLFFLCKDILGYDEFTETYHRGICSAYTLHRDKNQLHLHPRGHFKSTALTIGGSIQDLIIDSDDRILILNAVLTKAESFLFEIKQHFRINEVFKNLFPEMIPRRSDFGHGKTFTVANRRKIFTREGSVEVAAIGAASVSSHYDRLKFDDIVNEINCETQDQRKKVIKAYAQYLSLLDPPGHTMIVGTRWHFFEIYGHLLEEDKKLRAQGEEEDFVKFYTSVYKNGDEVAKVPSFPERFTPNHIANLERKQRRKIFSHQYLNIPVADGDKVLDSNKLRVISPEAVAKMHLNKFVTVDPSVSKKDSDDPAVILSVGVDCHGNIFIFDDIRRGWWNPNQQINQIIRAIEKHRPKITGIESVAFQYVLKFFLEEELRKRGIPAKIEEMKRPTNIRKEERIQYLQPMVDDGQIFLVTDDPQNLSPNFKQLITEMDQFPSGRHDDILDALADAAKIKYNPPKLQRKLEIRYEATDNSTPFKTGYRSRVSRRKQSA